MWGGEYSRKTLKEPGRRQWDIRGEYSRQRNSQCKGSERSLLGILGPCGCGRMTEGESEKEGGQRGDREAHGVECLKCMESSHLFQCVILEVFWVFI